MDVITLASLAALVVKIVSVAKALGKDTNYVLTQALTWLVSIALLFVAANATLTEQLVFAEHALGSLDGWSLVLAGLQLGSLGSFAYDVKKAVDRSDSAAEPKLLSS